LIFKLVDLQLVGPSVSMFVCLFSFIVVTQRKCPVYIHTIRSINHAKKRRRERRRRKKEIRSFSFVFSLRL